MHRNRNTLRRCIGLHGKELTLHKKVLSENDCRQIRVVIWNIAHFLIDLDSMFQGKREMFLTKTILKKWVRNVNYNEMMGNFTQI